MNEIFERNIERIKEYRQALWEDLEPEIEKFKSNPDGNENESFEWIQKPGKPTNLLYTRKKPEFRQLYHAEDPLKEVDEIFRKADLRFPQFVIFFGPGLGHLTYYFFKNRPMHNFAMVIIEKNPQIFLRSLCIYDFSDLLKEETAVFLVGEEVVAAKSCFNHLFQRFGTVERSLKILASPMALQSEPDYYQEIAASLFKTRDATLVTGGNSVEDCFIGFEDICRNARLAIQNTGAQAYFRKRKELKSRTIVSVAAGPSTEEHWDQIAKLQKKVPIVTCDVMLRPMLERGIVPDFVTALERCIEVAQYFEDVKIPSRTKLIGPMLLLPEAFEAFKGEKYLYCPTVQQARGLGFEYLAAFFPGGSSGNLNIYFATLMGFGNIIMVGHNLAYGYDKAVSHVPGTGVEDHERVLPESELSSLPIDPTQDGLSTVRTNRWWQLFRHHMEDTIANCPHMTFINTSAKGAKIDGTIYMPFDEALSKYAQEDLDIHELFGDVTQNVPLNLARERLADVQKNLSDGIDDIEKWLCVGQETLEKLEKWEHEILEAEKKSKPVSLDYLDKRIDEVLAKKVEAVNEDKIFYQFVITTILPAHVTFEREINEMPMKYTSNYELKKDFLLAHKKYFSIWTKWFPLMLKELRNSEVDLKEFEKQLPAAKSEESLADAIH